MKNQMNQNDKSTRQAAKEAGIMDYFFLCRKHVAVFFGLAFQAVPATVHILGLPSAWGSRPAPATAAGFPRLALSAGANAPGFSKPMRSLTEHETDLYPALL